MNWPHIWIRQAGLTTLALALHLAGAHLFAVWAAWGASVWFAVFETLAIRRGVTYSAWMGRTVRSDMVRWWLATYHAVVVLLVDPFGWATPIVVGALIAWLPFHWATKGAEAGMVGQFASKLWQDIRGLWR